MNVSLQPLGLQVDYASLREAIAWAQRSEYDDEFEPLHNAHYVAQYKEVEALDLERIKARLGL